MSEGSLPHRHVIGCGLLVLVLGSCSLPANTAPPDYIKQVSAYKEGSDGVFVYFVLADVNGQMTSSSGSATLTILERTLGGGEIPLFSKEVAVTASDFVQTKAGIGAFEHEILAFGFGRIPFSSFTRQPTETLGKVRLSFEVGGRTLKGEDSIVF